MEEIKEFLLDTFLSLMNVFLVLLVVLSIISVLFLPLSVGNEYFATKVSGNSMFPAKRSGDVGVFKIEKAENIAKGDVIVFREDPIFISHRVIEIKKGPVLMFLTKGDNNIFPDGWIEEDKIVAKNIFNIPLGFFLTFGGITSLFLSVIVLLLWKDVILLRRNDDSFSPKFNLAILSALSLTLLSVLKFLRFF